jgi:hypothetical protein
MACAVANFAGGETLGSLAWQVLPAARAGGFLFPLGRGKEHTGEQF